mgnify:FL=1
MQKRVFNLIIVDESGSMSCIENQALAGMNETLSTIVKMDKIHENVEQLTTLITFDSEHRKFVFDNAPASKLRTMTNHDYSPCGATPLYDAIGIGIAKVNALTSPEDNVLVTIITDGEENCSTEYNLKMVKNLIEKLKKQNWTFTFIGTEELDVEGMAASMGIDAHLSFKQDVEGTKAMFRKERLSRAQYCQCVAESMPIEAKSFFKTKE